MSVAELDIAEEHLLEIADEAAPVFASPGGAIRFITFRIGASVYALRTASVAEVTHLLAAAPLPHAPIALVGIAPHRGEMVAVLNIRQMLDEAPPQPDTRSKLIILRPPSGDDIQLAFAVDQIFEISVVGLRSIDWSDAPGCPIGGSLSLAGRKISIIDSDSLATCLKPA